MGIEKEKGSERKREEGRDEERGVDIGERGVDIGERERDRKREEER